MEKVNFFISLFIITVLVTYCTGMTFTLSRDELNTLRIKIAAIEDQPQENEEQLASLIPSHQDPKNIYAVLVAGSSGYFNYRHQADTCHAYQILHRNGIPDENIVVMMYDDVAHAEDNPTPGVIINRPNGTNVYEGVIKDYTGSDVNPDTFLKVLLGDEEGLRGIGSGKVLKSGPNDHVFINFVDHGAPGLVAFPDSELHAKELESVLLKMHEQKKFQKLVFYLEACESGSMFDKLLPIHLNIFATTAANSTESSYACYYDNERNTYLGDVYSVMWMENSDQVNLETETLQKQFLVVKKETNTSHVKEFGDKTLRGLPVADFLGNSSTRIVYSPVELDAVDSRDVARILLERKVELSRSLKERKDAEIKLSRFHKMRSLVTTQFMDILSKVTLNDSQEKTLILRSRLPIRNFNCYEPVAKYYSSHCLSIAKNPYVMGKLYIFVNLCERGWSAESMIEAMAHTCHTTGAGIQNGVY